MLGKRWTLPILKIVSSKEATRFCEIKKALAGISNTVLSERLAELEREGLVARTRASKIEYRLTAGAKELEPVLAELDRLWPARRHTILSIQ
jgi:DNA-binding HxlR family transcriptional regulator